MMKSGHIKSLWILAPILISISSCGPYISLPPYSPPPSTPPYRTETAPAKKNVPELTSPKSTNKSVIANQPSQSIPVSKTPQHLASLELVKKARDFALSGKIDTAIEYLERAIELDSYNGDAFYEMARCWEIKGDHDKALAFIDRSIRIFQGRPNQLRKSYLFKAAILRASGKEEEAKKILDLANSLKGALK